MLGSVFGYSDLHLPAGGSLLVRLWGSLMTSFKDVRSAFESRIPAYVYDMVHTAFTEEDTILQGKLIGNAYAYCASADFVPQRSEPGRVPLSQQRMALDVIWKGAIIRKALAPVWQAYSDSCKGVTEEEEQAILTIRQQFAARRLEAFQSVLGEGSEITAVIEDFMISPA